MAGEGIRDRLRGWRDRGVARAHRRCCLHNPDFVVALEQPEGRVIACTEVKVRFDVDSQVGESAREVRGMRDNLILGRKAAVGGHIDSEWLLLLNKHRLICWRRGGLLQMRWWKHTISVLRKAAVRRVWSLKAELQKICCVFFCTPMQCSNQNPLRKHTYLCPCALSEFFLHLDIAILSCCVPPPPPPHSSL